MKASIKRLHEKASEVVIVSPGMSFSKHAEETIQASTPIDQVADHMQLDDLRRAIRRSTTMCYKNTLHTRGKLIWVTCFPVTSCETFDRGAPAPGQHKVTLFNPPKAHMVVSIRPLGVCKHAKAAL